MAIVRRLDRSRQVDRVSGKIESISRERQCMGVEYQLQDALNDVVRSEILLISASFPNLSMGDRRRNMSKQRAGTELHDRGPIARVLASMNGRGVQSLKSTLMIYGLC